MKIYATTTSERASKGQGGNEYIEIELKAFDREKPIGTILLTTETDATGKKNQYLVKWQDADDKEKDNWLILLEGHEKEGVIQHSENRTRDIDGISSKEELDRANIEHYGRTHEKGNKQKGEAIETVKQALRNNGIDDSIVS